MYIEQHLKSTNMLERFHQEIKRRTLVVRIFPNGALAACARGRAESCDSSLRCAEKISCRTGDNRKFDCQLRRLAGAVGEAFFNEIISATLQEFII